MHQHYSLEERQVMALEHLTYEICAIQDTLEVLTHHLIGSTDQMAEVKAEAAALREKLKKSRTALFAAIAAAPPKE